MTTAKTTRRAKREYVGGRYRYVPKFDIEPCNLYGDTAYIVRLNGRIVTTIPAQETRKQARQWAASYARTQRKPADTRIPCPF
jgi:hypothetical protein